MEYIPGGKAKGGRCPVGVAKSQIALGTRVELEHTRGRGVGLRLARKRAREIACDHLTEDRRYYVKLRKAGLIDE